MRWLPCARPESEWPAKSEARGFDSLPLRFVHGGLAEWFKAAVLKTAGGGNPASRGFEPLTHR